MARLDKNPPALYGPRSARGYQSFDLGFPALDRALASKEGVVPEEVTASTEFIAAEAS